MTATAPTHDAMLAINGVNLYVEEQGSGALIVCIHGAGGTTLAWTAAIEKLSRLGRVIAYDRRGCSRSGRPRPCKRTSASRAHRRRRGADRRARGRSGGGHRPQLRRNRGDGPRAPPPRPRPRARAARGDASRELAPAVAEWVDRLTERLLDVAARDGVDEVAQALITEVAGESAWPAFPAEIRRLLEGNGPAILAEVLGEWWLNADTAALAAIRQPVLLVAAADSPPEFCQPVDALTAALPNARMALIPWPPHRSRCARGGVLHRGDPRERSAARARRLIARATITRWPAGPVTSACPGTRLRLGRPGRGRWKAAFGRFDRATRSNETAEAHEGLSWAAWWLDARVVFAARGRAYQLYRERGDVAAARGWRAGSHVTSSTSMARSRSRAAGSAGHANFSTESRRVPSMAGWRSSRGTSQAARGTPSARSSSPHGPPPSGGRSASRTSRCSAWRWRAPRSSPARTSTKGCDGSTRRPRPRSRATPRCRSRVHGPAASS